MGRPRTHRTQEERDRANRLASARCCRAFRLKAIAELGGACAKCGSVDGLRIAAKSVKGVKNDFKFYNVPSAAGRWDEAKKMLRKAELVCAKCRGWRLGRELLPKEKERIVKASPGRTLRELAAEFNVSHETIRKILRDGGVGLQRRRITNELRNKIIAAASDNSVKAIADRFGVTYSTVYSVLLKAGVEPIFSRKKDTA